MKQIIIDQNGFPYYLTPGPWAASSQGMQDDPGAKSANWLCGCLSMWLSCRLRFHLVSQRCTSSRQVGFLSQPGGVPLSVVRPCLHGTVCHCHTQNKFMIPSKYGEAIFQCGRNKIPLPE